MTPLNPKFPSPTPDDDSSRLFHTTGFSSFARIVPESNGDESMKPVPCAHCLATRSWLTLEEIMRKIVGKALSNVLLLWNKYGHAIIGLIGSAWVGQRAGASENEGLGATYDKRKWVEAYYDMPDAAAPERMNGDTFRT